MSNFLLFQHVINVKNSHKTVYILLFLLLLALGLEIQRILILHLLHEHSSCDLASGTMQGSPWAVLGPLLRSGAENARLAPCTKRDGPRKTSHHPYLTSPFCAGVGTLAHREGPTFPLPPEGRGKGTCGCQFPQRQAIKKYRALYRQRNSPFSRAPLPYAPRKTTGQFAFKRDEGVDSLGGNYKQ